MKRLLSVFIIIVIVIQLTACGLISEEKNAAMLQLKNPADDSFTEIKADSEKVYFNGTELLAFQSELDVHEMAESLSQMNSDFTFEVIDNGQLLMDNGKENDSRYTLFSKYVADEEDNPVGDLYVVVNERGYANQPQEKMNINFPYHLANTYFTFSAGDGELYSLTDNLNKPFYNLIELRASMNAFTNIVEFYENCGYRVTYEGGNLTGGNICVYSGAKSFLQSSTPLFQILIMKSKDRMAMRYCAGKDVYELKAEEVVGRYVDAINRKNAEEYLNCFKKIDGRSADVFLNSVKSCKNNNSELFWMDQSNHEYILKLDRTLVSEDGKQMGSLGTGEVNYTDYWLVKIIDGEPKIICQYKSFSDTISELTVYKEFNKSKEDNLVDWLFNVTPTK